LLREVIPMNKTEALSLHQKGQPESCPLCGSTRFIKYGKAKNRNQRYQCKLCMKTFSQNTNNFFMYSKKPVETWEGYISSMAKGLTLRSIANQLSISLTTSFFWRHKILSAANGTADKTLTGIVEIYELKLKESFKGSRNMPKQISVSKSDNFGDLISSVIETHGQGRNNIIILSCIDSMDNMVMKAAARTPGQRLQKSQIDKALGPLVKNVNAIATSPNLKYIAFAKENKLKLSMGSANRIPGLYPDRAKKLSLMFKKFIRRFRNISSKYLSHYLNLFVILQKNDLNTADKISNRLICMKRKLRIYEFKNIRYDGSFA
jgi:transposase-like protein